MAKDYNDSDGRWVTISGRKVFIAEGQSLSDAMKKSGKFDKKGIKRKAPDSYIDSKITSKDDKAVVKDLEQRKEQLKQRKNRYTDEEYKKQEKGLDDGIKYAKGQSNTIPRDYEKITYTQKIESSAGKVGDKFELTKDEYDRPITKNLRTGETYQANLSMLKSKDAVEINDIAKNEIPKGDNKLIDNDMTIKELDDTAQWLYDNDRNEWDKFTDNEIKELAKLSQITNDNPGGRAYDDEVFEEMEKRGLKLDNKKEPTQADRVKEAFKKYDKENKGGISLEELKERYGSKNEYTRDELKSKYGTDNVDLINAGKESKDRVKLNEKQISEGNRLNAKAKTMAEEDVQTYLSGKSGYEGSEDDFVRDMADNYGITQYDAKRLYEDTKKNLTKGEAKVSNIKVKGENNIIPRDFEKGYGRFKVLTTANDDVNDRFEITKDENGFRAKNLRTGETYATFRDYLSNNNVFEFEKNEKSTNETMNESIREKTGKTKADRNIDAFDDDNKKESQRRLNTKYDYNTPGKIGNMKTEDFVKQRNEFNAKADKLWNDNKVDSKQKKISDDAKSGKISKKEAYKRIFNLHDDNFKQLNQISKNYDDEVVASKKPMYSERSNVIKRAMARMSDENKAKTRDAREELRKELNESGFGKSIKNAVKENKMFKEWQRYRKSHPNSDISLTSFKQKYKG